MKSSKHAMSVSQTDSRPLVKRRVSRDPEQVKPTHGQSSNDYERIVERVVTEKTSKTSVEALKERMKLLTLMQEDCSALILKKKEIHRKKRRRERLQWLLSCVYVILAIIMVAVGVLATWFLVQLRPEGAVSF